MSASSATFSRSNVIKWLITFIITMIFVLIPSQGFYDGNIKNFFIITVFSLCVIAFEFFPLLIMAAVMPILWVFTGVCSFETAMGPWMGSTMPMMVGIFVMVACLEESGLITRIAFFLMSKVSGSYMKLCFAIYFVSFLISVITLGNAQYIMCVLCAGTCFALKVQNKKAGACIAMAGMLGACSSHAFTYSAQGIAVIQGVTGDLLSNLHVTPVSYLLHNWPMIIICGLILFITVKWYKPEEEFGSTSYFKDQLTKMGKISKKEIINGVMLACVLLYICTSGLHGMDISYAFSLIPYIVFLPFLKGGDEQTLKKVNWQMIFFVSACMSIGTVAVALGIGNVLGQLCLNIFTNMNNIFIISLALFGLIFGMNFLMTPMAIWSLLANPLMMAVTELGYDPLPFVYELVACSEAIIFPYEYIPYLLFFSMGIIKMGDFIKLNIMRSVVFFAGFICILIPYWMLIGIV